MLAVFVLVLVVAGPVSTGPEFTFGPPRRVDATFVFDDGTTTTVTYLAEEGPDGNFYVRDPPPLQ